MLPPARGRSPPSPRAAFVQARSRLAVGPAQLVPPVDDEVLSFDVAEVTKSLAKGLRRVRIGRIEIHQDTDPRWLSGLWSGSGGKRRGRHTEREEREYGVTPVHS